MFPRFPMFRASSPKASHSENAESTSQHSSLAPDNTRQKSSGLLGSLRKFSRPHSPRPQNASASHPQPIATSPGTPPRQLQRLNALSKEKAQIYNNMALSPNRAPQHQPSSSSTKNKTSTFPSASTSRPVLPKNHEIPLETLAPALQNSLNKRFDPVQSLGLKDQTVFFRLTDKEWLNNEKGKLSLNGNPDSMARIANHTSLRSNPLFKNKEHWAALPAETKAKYLNDETMRYVPSQMKANELGDPTLNVMWGVDAKAASEGYRRKKDQVLVKMTLGDLKRAGGGKVFFDTSSVASSSGTRALIVTLPENASVPVQLA